MRINNLFESATAGGTSSGSVASVSKPLGKVLKRAQKPGTNALDGSSLFGEDQQVKELSNEKLGQYKKAAGADASAADRAGDTKKGNKRFKGIVKATNKQFANDAKKNVKEGLGRMSGSPSAYDRDYASSVSGMGRGPDHRGLGQELAHETNNIAISINGKVWKVVPGRGTADSREEKNYLNGMQSWAEKKSAATGKKWSVSLTGANVSEGVGTKKPQPYNDPNWTKNLPKEKLDAIAGQRYNKDKKDKGVAEGVRDLGYDAQSLIMKLRRDVEEKRLQPTRQAVLAAARELAGDMAFAPELLVQQVLGQGVAEGFNGEYDDEAGMADNNLETMKRAVDGIDELISAGDNLPEWCQEKIAVAKSMLVTVWDYMASEEERGAEVNEHKKGVRAMTYTAKPRNFVAKNAAATTSRAGAHKDKKKAAKQGEVKHKNKEPAYESKLFTALENKLK